MWSHDSFIEITFIISVKDTFIFSSKILFINIFNIFKGLYIYSRQFGKSKKYKDENLSYWNHLHAYQPEMNTDHISLESVPVLSLKFMLQKVHGEVYVVFMGVTLDKYLYCFLFWHNGVYFEMMVYTLRYVAIVCDYASQWTPSFALGKRVEVAPFY